MIKPQLKQLQLELAAAATEISPDVNLIQEITNKITRLDTENVRFTIDAGIISRLGQELVGKQETAVAELIKNAYDADATEVRIVFSNTDAPGGTLLIEDNGLGMTREQLLDGFMRLSSTDKLLNPISERGRRKAGRKGIGRFAVQRLGEELELTTQTKGSNLGLRVLVNWEEFRPGRDLGSITSHVDVITKQRPYGTTLFIKNLRESWSNAEQRRVYRYVSELIQPVILTKFKSSKATNSPASSVDLTAFDVKLIQQNDDEETVIASQEETVFANALAVIEGYVDNNGFGTWSVGSEKLGIKEEVSKIGSDRDNKKPFPNLRDVSIKAYYYIWAPELFPKLLFGSLQDIGRQQGGIKVYRNGFRVAPYGDRGDDWLELDASYAGRRFLPGHANNNFIGLIELNDPNGELFEEKASREGLIERPVFKELQDFAYRTLLAGVLRVAEVRNKKQTAGQADWQKKPDADTAAKLRDSVARMRAAITAARNSKAEGMPLGSGSSLGDESGNSSSSSDNKNDSGSDEYSSIEDEVDTFEGIATDAQRLLQENQMLRVLASLGIMIGEFTHEIRQNLGSAQINTDFLRKKIQKGTREGVAFDHLASNISLIRSYASYFYQTVAGNASREIASQDLRSAGRHFEEAMAKSIKKAGIEFDFIPEGYELLTPPMHSSEVSSLLFNFYSNALKAIRRAGRKGRMLLRVGKENSRVFLEFSDNGDGIPEDIKGRIFNAFFTTATPASRNSTFSEEAQGSGLGLKIVHDIVDVYGGEVFITTPPDTFVTCFRVEFPAFKTNEHRN